MSYIEKKSQKRPWMADRKEFEGRVQSAFYWSVAWRRLRAAYVRKYPLCCKCQEEGRVTPTQEIDHKIPINPIDAYDLKNGKYGHPLDEANLQPLCKKCHAAKTARSKGREIR
jgi:5-methylcytosine-specific restriction endonuclease McrA